MSATLFVGRIGNMEQNRDYWRRIQMGCNGATLFLGSFVMAGVGFEIPQLRQSGWLMIVYAAMVVLWCVLGAVMLRNAWNGKPKNS